MRRAIHRTRAAARIRCCTKESAPLSLRWTLYDPSLNSIPLYEMNTAQTGRNFRQRLRNWSWPTQNLVYADDQGHIAYHAIGQIPMRPGGLTPVPIATERTSGTATSRSKRCQMPFDPPSGFLATANSRVTTDQSPYPLSQEWIDPYRAERIYKMLDGRNGLTPKDMLADADRYVQRDGSGVRAAACLCH